MAETQVTGRQIKDKSVFDLDIDLTQAPVHPTLVSSDRLVIVDPTDGNIKTSTFANLLTGLDTRYLLLSGGTVSGNLIVSGTTTLNGVTKVGTNLVTNLNADLLDGNHASAFALSSHSHAYEPVIIAGTTAQYWRGDKTWQTMPAFPSISAATTQVLYMSGTNIVGSPGFQYNPASGDFSVGVYAQSGGGNSFAMGTNAVAYADSAIAIGYGADSEGGHSICIGTSAVTYADYCVSIGVEASANGNNGIAIGRGAVANDANDITLGSDTYNNKTSIYGLIKFPSITSNGYLKILDGEVYIDAGGSSGTVTSVGLSMPSMFTVTGSPVTTSGTLTATLASQTKNFVLVAPQFANGVPTFRKLTADDMPDLSAMYDNYYSWGVKLNAGTQFNILKYGATGYTNYYNGINFIAGTGVTLTASSVAGGALGITIDSSASVSGNEFTMIGRNTTGFGVYSELTSLQIMRLISNNSGSDQCSFFDATGVWSRRDNFVTTGASNVTYTGQTLVNITGLAILLGANSTYEYEAILSVQTSAVTTGIQYAIAYTAGYSQFSGQIIGNVNTSYSRGNLLSINTASATFMTTSNQSGQILIKGYIKTSGIGGTLSIKHLKVTSGTSTILPYSYFRVNLISTQ